MKVKNNSIFRIHCSVIIFIVTSFSSCYSQSNAIYRNHLLHKILINPAISGSEYFPNANISHNKQWLGISQSPHTTMASTSLRMGNFDFYNPKMFINKSKLKSYERIGMGLGIYSDNNGPVSIRGMNMAYAYHISLDGAVLSLGLSGNIEQSILDETKWNPTTIGDPILGNQKESLFSFNTNVGAYFYSSSYFAGFAVNNILPLENKEIPGEKIKQDFLVQGGYMFKRMNDLKFEPRINLHLLDYKNIEFDIQLRMYIQHIHWLALTYRSYQALNVMAGYRIGKIYIAYSYEANLSPVIKYSTGTHGINIGLNLGVRQLEGF